MAHAPIRKPASKGRDDEIRVKPLAASVPESVRTSDANSGTRYLIVNAYSAKNVGDAAINLATAALLRKGGPARIEISGRHHRRDRQFYARYGIEAVPPAIPFAPPGDGSVLSRGWEFAAGSIWATILLIPLGAGLRAVSRSLARWSGSAGLLELLAADVVVLAGGGYLFSARRKFNASLLHSLAILWLASVTHRRLVMMPQSIGPLDGWFDRWLVKKTLGRVTPIVVRETTSFAEVVELLHPNDVRLCPDVTLYGWVAPVTATPRTGQRARIGVVVMDWTWARGATQQGLERYMRELATLIADLKRAGIDAVLLGGSKLPELGQDDMVVAERIATLVLAETGNAPELVELSDPETFQSLLSTLDLVVGTRLHSCLLAFASGVPAIGLGYQPKTRGTFELLGMDEVHHDVESFTASAVGRQVFAILASHSEWSDRVRRAAQQARGQIEAFYSGLL